MKVFVTGVNGQLGHDVMNELAKRGYEGVGSDLAPEYAGVADGTAVTKAPYVSLDITDVDAVDKIISEVNPDVIVHCAAWTAVDMAEDDDKVAAVRKVNVDGTQNIANVAKKLDAPMVYLSTDYVFDGQGTTPWEPDFKGYKPLNVYGETKLGGEEAVANTLDKYFIVRIAWVFGVNGSNFIKTMLKVGSNHDEVKVVSDQVGTPTYTFDLARLLVDMIETDKYGYKTKVTPVTTEEYGLSKAVRPFNSRLDKSKLEENGFKPLPTWPDAISRYLNILKADGFFDELGK